MIDKDDMPIFKNQQVVVFGEIQVDEGTKCVFKPWMDEGRTQIGWEASELTRTTYIYIAPILDSEGTATFYLYIGPHGDPSKDRRLGPYDMEGGSNE